MRAFVGSEVTKPELIASLEAHRAADRIARGFSYWTGNGAGRGCAVGCSLHDFRRGAEGQHALYEPLFGVPRAIAYLEDRIFEGLPVAEAPDWPLRFTRAIAEGADLSRVVPGFLFRVIERRRGALRDGPHRARVEAAMDRVLTVLAGWRETGVRPYDAGGEVLESARSTRADAAADAAAYDAAYAAADAADVAAAAAYARTARESEYRWMADVLIEEIERAEVA
jgi:hypothetical protein